MSTIVLNGIGEFPNYLAGMKAPDWAVVAVRLVVLSIVLIIARCSPILVAVALGRSDVSLGVRGPRSPSLFWT